MLAVDPLSSSHRARFQLLQPKGFHREGQPSVSVRTIKNPIRAGRAQQLPEWQTREGCTCEGWIVHPDGQIKACGCEDSPVLGDVFDGIDHEKYPYATSCDCWNDWEEMEEMDQTG